MTLAQLVDLWLRQFETIGRSPTTLRKYRSIANSVVVPALGTELVRQLRPRQLDRLYADLVAQGNKATTVRRVHALISAALRQGERWDLVDRNVARRARPPEIYTEEVQAPSAAEVRSLLRAAEACDPMVASLLTLAALTGARRGELCALRWADFDEERQVLRIARSLYACDGGGWSEKPTKNRQVRRLALDNVAMGVLAERREAATSLAGRPLLRERLGGFVFSRSLDGSEPIRPDQASKIVARIATAAGVDVTLQGLRHFSATQLVAGGHDPRTVAGRLGHLDPGLTLRTYSHVLPQRDREAAASLGQIVKALGR